MLKRVVLIWGMVICPILIASNAEHFQAVPEGFEDLKAVHEAMVHVYLEGTNLGEYLATIDENTIKFDHPDRIVKKLDEQIIEKKHIASLRQYLASTIHFDPSNSCPDKKEGLPICRFPETLAEPEAVYGENTFRLDVLVPSDYYVKLGKQSKQAAQLHHVPFSFVNNVDYQNSINQQLQQSSISMNGTLDNTGAITVGRASLNYDLQTNMQENRSSGTETSNTYTQFDELYLSYYRHRYVASVGYLTGFNDTFLLSPDFLGVEVQTEDKLVNTGTNNLYDSNMVVFLDRASTVRVLRNGRLLYTKYLRAGEHDIDTSSFPSGTYEVTIEKIDNLGKKTTETRVFTRIQNLVPYDFPTITVYAGELVDVNGGSSGTRPLLPSESHIYITSVSYDKRIADHYAWLNQAGTLNNIGLLASGFQYDNEVINNELMGAVTTFNTYGLIDNASYSRNNWSGNLTLRQFFQFDHHLPNALNRANDDNGSVFIGNQRSSITSNVSYRVGAYSFSVGGNYSRNFGDATKNYQVFYRAQRTFNLSSNTRASLQASYTDSSTDSVAELQFNLTFSREDFRLQNLLTADLAREQASSQQNYHPVTNEVQIDYTPMLSNKLNLQLLSSLDANYWQNSGNIGVEHQNRYFDGSAEVGQTFKKDKPLSRRYQFTGDASLVYAGGHFTISPSIGNDLAGVLVHVESDEHANFSAGQGLSNGRSFHSSAPVYVPLSSLNAKKIRLQLLDELSMHFDETPQEFRLQPNAVAVYRVKAFRIHDIFMRVTHADGKPLVNAYTEVGIDPLLTDEDGYVQMQIPKKVRNITFTYKGGNECVVRLPGELKEEHGLVLLEEDQVCEPVTKNNGD